MYGRARRCADHIAVLIGRVKVRLPDRRDIVERRPWNRVFERAERSEFVAEISHCFLSAPRRRRSAWERPGHVPAWSRAGGDPQHVRERTKPKRIVSVA